MKKKLLVSLIAMLGIISSAFAKDAPTDANEYWNTYKAYLIELTSENGMNSTPVAATKNDVTAEFYTTAVEAWNYFDKNSNWRTTIITKVNAEISDASLKFSTSNATKTTHPLYILIKKSKENVSWAVMTTCAAKYNTWVNNDYPAITPNFNGTDSTALVEVISLRDEIKALQSATANDANVTFNFTSCISHFLPAIKTYRNVMVGKNTGTTRISTRPSDANIAKYNLWKPHYEHWVKIGELADDATNYLIFKENYAWVVNDANVKVAKKLLTDLDAKEALTLGTDKSIDEDGDYKDLKRIKELWGVAPNYTDALLSQTTKDNDELLHYATKAFDNLVDQCVAMEEAIAFAKTGAGKSYYTKEGAAVPADFRTFTDLKTTIDEMGTAAKVKYIKQVINKLDDAIAAGKTAYINDFKETQANTLAENFVNSTVKGAKNADKEKYFIVPEEETELTTNVDITADDLAKLKSIADTYHKFAYITTKDAKATSVSTKLAYEETALNTDGALTLDERYAIGQEVQKKLKAHATKVMDVVEAALKSARLQKEAADLAKLYTDKYTALHDVKMEAQYVSAEDYADLKAAVDSLSALGTTRIQANTNKWSWVGIVEAAYNSTSAAADFYVKKNNTATSQFGKDVINEAKKIINPAIGTDISNLSKAANWLVKYADLIAMGAPEIVAVLDPSTVSPAIVTSFTEAMKEYNALTLKSKIDPAVYDQFYAAWNAIIGDDMPTLTSFAYVDGTGKTSNIAVATANGYKTWSNVAQKLNEKRMVSAAADALNARNTVVIFEAGSDLNVNQIAALPANVIYKHTVKGATVYEANEIDFYAGAKFGLNMDNVKAAKVTVHKSLSGKKQDLYLPFAISKENMAKLNADGIKIYYYSGITETEEEEGKVAIEFGYRVKKANEQTHAYMPYMIEGTSNGTFTLYDVTFEKYATDKGTVDFNAAASTWTFAGTHTVGNYKKGDIYLYEGALTNASKDATGTWYPGAVKLTSSARNINYVVRFVGEEDGQATAIECINANDSENETEGIYNVSGVKVQNMNKPGLYIKNGKKVMVK